MFGFSSAYQSKNSIKLIALTLPLFMLSACTTFSVKETKENLDKTSIVYYKPDELFLVSTEINELDEKDDWRPDIGSLRAAEAKEKKIKFDAQLVYALKNKNYFLPEKKLPRFSLEKENQKVNYEMQISITGHPVKESISTVIGRTLLSALSLFIYPSITTKPYTCLVVVKDLKTGQITQSIKSFELSEEMHGAIGAVSINQSNAPYVDMVLVVVKSMLKPES
ncbi:MAG: hypothetical protein ACXVCP_08435 [Bdellovibrio sp.]